MPCTSLVSVNLSTTYHGRRESLHRESEERNAIVARQTALLVDMLQHNTALTETIKLLTERIEALTREVHGAVVRPSGAE